MSHFTHVSAEIRDLDACNKALNNMGLTMQSYGSCRYYFGTEMKENVVRLPGQYDMALEKVLVLIALLLIFMVGMLKGLLDREVAFFCTIILLRCLKRLQKDYIFM